MAHRSIEDFQGASGEMRRLLTRLVETESPSTDKAAVDRLGAIVAKELSDLGAEVRIDRQATAGDHIAGHWGGEAGAKAVTPGVLLLCHMDTVYETGTIARRPLREAGGWLYGPGVLDMKAGIVIALAALKKMRERGEWPACPVTALFTSDEETGSHTSRPLIEALAGRAALALCLEPALPDGALKTARKGTGMIQITTTGRSAHAGVDHEKGLNAIEELAHHILAAQKLTDYAAGTTLNVGVVSGGSRPNVVPDQARAVVDFRVASESETRRVISWAQNLRPALDGAGVTAAVELNRPPMPRDETMIDTFWRVQAIAARLGLQIGEGSTGGGSDANFVAALGGPVLDGLGGIGGGAHSENEAVLLSSLPERAALLAAILSELDAEGRWRR